MARTKGKPGPKPKYGDREEIHVLVPVDNLNYIRSVTENKTEWIIQAIQEKRQMETIIRACDKDIQALAMLYEQYKEPLGKYLIGLVHDQEVANNLYNETFTRVLLYISPKIVPRFEPWLYRIARNVANEYLRFSSKFTFQPLPEDEMHIKEGLPE